MSPAACFPWLTCMSDCEEKVWVAFSTSVSRIYSCKTGTLALGGQDSLAIAVVNVLADLATYISSSILDNISSLQGLIVQWQDRPCGDQHCAETRDCAVTQGARQGGESFVSS